MCTNQKLQVKKLFSDSKVPCKKYPTDAGLDIFSYIDTVLKPGCRETISTGISMTTPNGYYTRVAPRSGFAHKNGIDTLAGVIDETYTGELKVILINHGSEDFFISKGDRIAQLIVTKILLADCEVVENLESTDRGSLGFGSSGKK